MTDLTLTVLSVRLEDDPYKTQVRGTTPYFYVRQILRLKDTSGNLVTFRVTPARQAGIRANYPPWNMLTEQTKPSYSLGTHCRYVHHRKKQMDAT